MTAHIVGGGFGGLAATVYRIHDAGMSGYVGSQKLCNMCVPEMLTNALATGHRAPSLAPSLVAAVLATYLAALDKVAVIGDPGQRHLISGFAPRLDRLERIGV
jgi:hypothetical protein